MNHYSVSTHSSSHHAIVSRKRFEPREGVTKPAAKHSTKASTETSRSNLESFERPEEARSPDTRVASPSPQSDRSNPSTESPPTPSNAASLKEAMQLVDTGKPGEAISLLEKILQNDPTNEVALTELGMVHLIDMKDPDSAIGYLERVITTNPNNKVVLAELVGLYEEREQNGFGLGFLQEVYEKNPTNSTLAMGIGQMLAANEQGEEAIPYLEKAVKLETSPGASTELADVYSELGQPEKAQKYYELSVNKATTKEGRVMAKVDLISHHLEQGNYANAEKVLMTIDLPAREGNELLAQIREEIERGKKQVEL